MQIIKFFKNLFQHNRHQEKFGEGLFYYYNPRMQYGLISSEISSTDVLVHADELGTNIHVGDKVRFDLKETFTGVKASNVNLV